MKKYYTLVAREGGDGSPWAPQSGDYERSVVADEREELIYKEEYRAKDVKIITSGDTQTDIDAAVAKLNAAL